MNDESACPKCGNTEKREVGIAGHWHPGWECLNCQWNWWTDEQVRRVFPPEVDEPAPEPTGFTDAEWTEFLEDFKKERNA